MLMRMEVTRRERDKHLNMTGVLHVTGYSASDWHFASIGSLHLTRKLFAAHWLLASGLLFAFDWLFA